MPRLQGEADIGFGVVGYMQISSWDDAMKMVFTTAEAVKICKVSHQTVIRRFDSEQLKGFRPPGNRFLRIPRDQLFAFMWDNGMPIDALESGKHSQTR